MGYGYTSLASVCLIACASQPAVRAQAVNPSPPQPCASHPTVAFEFQVDSPTRVIPDSTHPHPTPDPFAFSVKDATATVVQFVVDTTGTPVQSTLRFLSVPSAAMAQDVRAVFMQWRFRPARLAGCLVPQLLQTSVVP